MDPLYTSTRVHWPLAMKLDTVQAALEVHADRFSVTDPRGIQQQIQAHADLHPGDPDVAAYLQIPPEAFTIPEVGERHHVIPISLADIHHTLHDTRPVAFLVLIGRTLFLRAELSSTKRLIVRSDGEDEPAFGFLVLSMIGHLRNLTATRWMTDSTRAGRDAVDWARIIRRHKEVGVHMQVGAKRYDLREESDRIFASLLGTMTGEDDPARRRKLVQGRILQMLNGGAALSIDQMPYGYTLALTPTGAYAHDALRRRIPLPVLGEAEALRTLHTMHAEMASQQSIAREMARLERDGLLTRRAGQRYRLTFADAVDPQARFDVVRSFFRPQDSVNLPKPTAPDPDAIDDYKAGGDPSELFTPLQRLVISRIELIRTGIFCRGLASDIRERGLVIAGQKALTRDDDDEFGYFFLECPWPIPTDNSGRPVPSFGIDDAVLRASAARVLSSLRPTPPARTGGAAHRSRPTRRVLQGFSAWEDPSRGIQGNMIARRNRSNGGNNVVLFERPSTTGQALHKGWSKQSHNPTTFARATVRLSQLCDGVADAIVDAMRTHLLPGTEASKRTVLERLRDADSPQDLAARIRRQAEAKDQQAREATTAAAGARKLAAISIEAGDTEGATVLMQDAQRRTAEARDYRAQRDALMLQATELEAGSAPGASDEDADLRTSAYLVAGLRRAARNNGTGPAALGDIADESLKGWIFIPPTSRDEVSVSFTANLHIPLAAGGEAVLPINGSVADVRRTPGRRTQTDYRSPRRGEPARLVMGRGLSVEDAAARLGRARDRIITGSLTPWLIEHGVTSRGARAALVDHPFGFVRQVLYRYLLDLDLADLRGYGREFCDHVASVYSDPGTHWGDAACPDDTTGIADLVVTLAKLGPQRAVGVREASRLLGIRESVVRDWAMPRDRACGFRRPRYVRYTRQRQAFAAIACPHLDCEGTADTVVLLPEVAASGYGLLCSSCRRVPSTEGAWPRIVFPSAYLQPLTRTPESTLRNGPRTTVAPTPVAFVVDAA